MDLERRRVVTERNGVVAGSVWESRMKSDEVQGGIKVFNGEDNPQENGAENSTSSDGLQVDKRSRPKQSPVGVSGGKRKTWKSENSEGFERNPIQIAKQRSENKKNSGEQCKELSVSVDGIKKSPIQIKKTRSEVGKELSMSVDGIERSPVQKMKTRSMSQKGFSESSDEIERNSIPLRKVKSESIKAMDDESSDGVERNAELRKVKSEGIKALDGPLDGNERNSIPLVKGKLVTDTVLDETGSGNGIERDSVELRKEIVEGSAKDFEKISDIIKKTRSDENLEGFGVCEEKVITSSLDNVGQVKSPPKLDVGQVKSPSKLEVEDDDSEEDWDEVMEAEVDVKEMNISEQKTISPITRKHPPAVVIEKKKIHQRNERTVPISKIVRKQPPPVVNHPRIISKPTITKPIPVADESQRVPKSHSKLQSLVDLVMWRDVSKSAFVFGMGTFAILSSSYTKDFNISFISVVSYLGLVYLAAIFLFRSIVCRGSVDTDDTSQDHVVGEEEAIWLLKLILPYINEFLLNVRALFSGDPATTMKLAVLLFVLARCGSSITIWKMAKLGFFGLFTVPKVCSSYSTQLTAYGTFWVRRYRDAWESCSHKKAVAFVIFTVVWNLSSIVARIWAVFMLFVAFRYYQQSMMREEWVVEEEEAATGGGGRDSWQDKGQNGGQRQGRGHGPTSIEIKIQKKRS